MLELELSLSLSAKTRSSFFSVDRFPWFDWYDWRLWHVWLLSQVYRRRSRCSFHHNEEAL